MSTIVLMMTCYKFKRTWEPFFKLYDKYWNDCPYELVMGTDVGEYANVKCIQIGKDLGWSSNCIHVLKKLNVDRVILMLDDYFIYEPVNTAKICDLVEISYKYDIDYLRLFPCPGPTEKWTKSKELGVIKSSDQYRASLQVAIWNKQMFLELLKEGETAWETEIEGSRRSAKMDALFLSVWRDQSPIRYEIAVLGGKWRQVAIDIMKRENLSTEGIKNIIKR